MVRALFASVIWLVLAACGGGGGGGGDAAAGGVTPDAGGPRVRVPFVLPVVPPADPRINRLAAFEAQKIRVLGGPGAGLAPTTNALPARGNLAFAGFASLRVESAPVLTLFGDAALTADFAAATVTGTMTGFFGTGPGAAVADYSGTLAITGGQTAPDLQLRYRGSLAGPGQQIAVSGTLAGGFLGDPVSALQALDLDTQAVANGQSLNATLLVVAERAGSP